MQFEPWELNPDIWKTENAFFSYLRGGLRLIWSRYPAKLKWKKSQMISPPEGYLGRAKSLGKCHYCSEMFAASHLEVDHVSQAGACNSWESAQEFLHNLLDCNDNWVLACKPCHKIKSYAERTGLPFADAMLEKQIISFMKKPTEEILVFLADNGYNTSTLKNAAVRKKAVTEIFRKEYYV